jgi:hypothetical protein
MAPTPVTILSPVPWWWAGWVRLTWVLAWLCPPLVARLRELRFIRFAHWALAARWPPDRSVRRDRAAARCLVFLTTYDGSENEYFDAFVRVVGLNIRAAYWRATAFPPLTYRSIDAYLKAHLHEPEHTFCANPAATVRTTEQAVELRRRLDAFARRAQGASPGRFAGLWREFLVEAESVGRRLRGSPRGWGNRVGATYGLIVVARIAEGRADAARTALATLGDPFARVPGTSLARLQIVRPPRRRLTPGRPREHVLWAADVDAPLGSWLRDACAEIGPELDAVLGQCAFWPGSADPAGVARWVAANELRVGFSVVGAPRARVDEVAAALQARDDLAAFARETRGLDDRALLQAWERFRG